MRGFYLTVIGRPAQGTLDFRGSSRPEHANRATVGKSIDTIARLSWA